MNKGFAIYRRFYHFANDIFASGWLFARAFNLPTPFSKGKYILSPLTK